MSKKYKFRSEDHLHFISFSTVNWLDIFIRNTYKNILLESWKYCINNKGMELYAWCIMTSHVHMIIGSHGSRLAAIMRDMKRHTSIKLREAIATHPGESRREWLLWMMERAGKKKGDKFQLWQDGNHPIMLWSPKVIHQKLNYIHYNPVVAGIVERPEDYLYSSARDYSGMERADRYLTIGSYPDYLLKVKGTDCCQAATDGINYFR